jgi:hypothetical protein
MVRPDVLRTIACSDRYDPWLDPGRTMMDEFEDIQLEFANLWYKL